MTHVGFGVLALVILAVLATLGYSALAAIREWEREGTWIDGHDRAAREAARKVGTNGRKGGGP